MQLFFRDLLPRYGAAAGVLQSVITGRTGKSSISTFTASKARVHRSQKKPMIEADEALPRKVFACKPCARRRAERNGCEFAYIETARVGNTMLDSDGEVRLGKEHRGQMVGPRAS